MRTQSNGKLARWHRSLKRECILPKTPLDLAEATRLVATCVDDYNQYRLHGAIGYIAPADRLASKATEILANREQKLARDKRAKNRRLQLEQAMVAGLEVVS